MNNSFLTYSISCKDACFNLCGMCLSYKQSDSFFTDVEAEGYIREHLVLKPMNDLPSRICNLCSGMHCLVQTVCKSYSS